MRARIQSTSAPEPSKGPKVTVGGDYRPCVPRADVWDLGSSSFHLLVCDHARGDELSVLLRRRARLNLGASVGARGSIPADRATAAVAAARRLRRALDDTAPDVVVALATAALRDAENGREIVARLEPVVGSPVRVLDGEEEARLCFAGQQAGVWTNGAPTFGVDLGGGSFEVALGTAGRADFAMSAPVGATRLLGELDAPERLGDDGRRQVELRTRRALEPVLEALAAYPGVAKRTVVSGGTARALARLATVRTRERGFAMSSEVNQVELPAGQVDELAARLAQMPLRERLSLPGMPTRRAPMLPIGATILSTLAAELEVERFVVSVWGLREGALLDALSRR
jgi:exopolyphosphatase/guanosine-5'-triphosphate,3'-diphosphate pyrophosphatase